MLHPPLSVLLNWPKPNYVDPVTRGNTRVILGLLLAPVIVFAVALRFYTRLTLTRSFGLDDVFIGIAVVPAVIETILDIVIDLHLGGTRHLWDLPPSWAAPVGKLFLMTQVLFCLAMTFTKLSLLVSFRRLLVKTQMKRIKGLNWLTLYVVLTSSISYICTVVFECIPIHAQWDILPSYPYTCVYPGYIVIFGAINAVNDFMMFVIPVPIVWNLQLPARQRIAVLSIFSLSLVACVAGSVRTYFTSIWASSYDLTWKTYSVGILSMIELHLGVLCACVPALRPFFARYTPRLMEPSISSEHSRQNCIQIISSGKQAPRLQCGEGYVLDRMREMVDTDKFIGHLLDARNDPRTRSSDELPEDCPADQMVAQRTD